MDSVHNDGREPVPKLLLYIRANGCARQWISSCRRRGWRLSGPGEEFLSIASTTLVISSWLICRGGRVLVHEAWGDWLGGTVLSYTPANEETNELAIVVGSSDILPSIILRGPTVGLPTLLCLMYPWKSFGAEPSCLAIERSYSLCELIAKVLMALLAALKSSHA